MSATSRHADMRLKVTAFLFNRRADALLTEMYEALCLHVLCECGEPCTESGVTELVGSVLGISGGMPNSLVVHVSEALQSLVQSGSAIHSEQQYRVADGLSMELANGSSEEQLLEAVTSEIAAVAQTLNPLTTRSQVEALRGFFIDVSDVIVQNQVRFITRGQGVADVDPDSTEVSEAVRGCAERYGIGEFIDPDEFIANTLVRPGEVLSSYLYTMVQVSVIMQLLFLDPSLEQFRRTLFSDRTLYLDSNVLFILMETTDPLNAFVTALLRATHEDLGVRLVVSRDTLGEYERTIEWTDRFFSENHSYYRNVARICRQEGKDPCEHFDLGNALFEDYMRQNLDHIDQGSWLKYMRSIRSTALDSVLVGLGAQIDTDGLPYVPDGEFEELRDAMLMASQKHVSLSRGGRSVKRDVDHDVKIFHLVKTLRGEQEPGNLWPGHSCYLMTLDRSLVHFCQGLGIAPVDTYFVYPNQWYEVTFPFLRMSARDHGHVASGLMSLVFSSGFPALASLMPLELCTYIFDHGGTGLSTTSIRNLVEALQEERLVDSLDPTTEDARSEEKTKLAIQRMIADEERKEREDLRDLERQKASLVSETGELAQNLATLESERVEIETTVGQARQKLEQYGGLQATAESIEERYGSLLDAEREAHRAAQKRADQAKERAKALAGKLAEVGARAEKAQRIADRVPDLEARLQRIEEERDTDRKRETEKKKVRGFVLLYVVAPVILVPVVSLVVGYVTMRLEWAGTFAGLAVAGAMVAGWAVLLDRKGSRVKSVKISRAFQWFLKAKHWVFRVALGDFLVNVTAGLLTQSKIWLKLLEWLGMRAAQ